MKRCIVTALAILLAVPIAGLAQSGPWGHRGSGMHGRQHKSGEGIVRLLRMGDRIDLTDKQRDDLKKMQTDFQLERIDHKAETEKAKVRLHSMMRDEAPEAEVSSAIDRVYDLKAEMQKMQYMHRMKIKELLSDEQRTKLKELRQSQGARGKEMGMRGKQGRRGFRRFGR